MVVETWTHGMGTNVLSREGHRLKKLLASAAVVAAAAIGIPVATAATASAAAPSTGALDRAWTKSCGRLPNGSPQIAHSLGFDLYRCFQPLGSFGQTSPQLQQLCDAMGGSFVAALSGSLWVQQCEVVQV
jgi:hypothetical protein